MSRLEKAFGLLGVKAEAKKCEGMFGLVNEATSLIEDTDLGTLTRDFTLLIITKKISQLCNCHLWRLG